VSSPVDKIVPKMQATHDELLTLIERAHRRFVHAVIKGRSPRLEGFDLDRWNEENVARRAGQTPDEIFDALRSERQETVAFSWRIFPTTHGAG
jgi:hypothetical protein